MERIVIDSVEFKLTEKQYEARLYHPDGDTSKVYGDIVYKGSKNPLIGRMRTLAREYLKHRGILVGDDDNTHASVRMIFDLVRG